MAQQTPTRPTRALSVSELNRQVRHLLEVSFLQVWVEGELSGFSRPRSGHWYFTLKDSRAQVSCAMFRSQNQRVRQIPREGDAVLIRGKVSLYQPRGNYQIIVESLEPAGVGELQKAFEALKEKLRLEGLFDASIKKDLPTIPRHIGVVTSRSGAAIHDVLTVLKRRCPGIPVTLYPATVQGETAAPSICRAIQQAESHGQADVLIVGRGGGSLEDLWPFNEESVARALAACTLPTISAVGHEVDVSISDFVADRRAPTPSAAAEMLVPDQSRWQQTLADQSGRLNALMRRQLRQLGEQITSLKTRLRDPRRELHATGQRLDELENRLHSRMQQRLTQLRHQVTNQSERLYSRSPGEQIQQRRVQLSQLRDQLLRNMDNELHRRKDRMTHLGEALNLVSPLATLDRGYAIVSTENQPVVRNAASVQVGEQISARLGRGSLEATVTATHPDSDGENDA